MSNGIYIKLEDILVLITEDKELRKHIAELPAIIIAELEDDTK